MQRNRTSFGFTSYQSGRIYFVGRFPDGRVSFHERHHKRAMGVVASRERVYLANNFQIWRMENVMPDGQMIDGFDRNYVPRNAQTTGDVDVHELGIMADGRVVFVNTKYSCLATFSPKHSFAPFWKPDFITELVPEDRCHLNGLAMDEGAPRFVTAVCRSNVVAGWRDRRAHGGCVIDVATQRVVTEDLSMPHSPRVRNGELFVLDSGRGELARVNIETGERAKVAFLPGFLRGLAFVNTYALVGLSLPRDGSFKGLALDDELRRRDGEAWCGVQIIDLNTGGVVEWIKLEGEIRELFDVFALPGVACPKATGLLDSEIEALITLDTPEWERRPN